MGARPCVLVVTCHLPYPAVSGGRRRELELFRRIKDDFDLHLCAVSKTPAEDRNNAGELGDVFSSIPIFEADGGPRDGCPQARHRCLPASSFFQMVTLFLRDRVARGRLERAALELATSLPTWDDAAAALVSCYESSLSSAPAASSSAGHVTR